MTLQSPPKRRGRPPKPKTSFDPVESIVEAPTLPATPKLETISYAFAIQHDGKALYSVMMHTIQNGQIIATHRIADGLYMGQAMKRLTHSVLQIVVNQIDPKRLFNREVMPSISGQM